METELATLKQRLSSVENSHVELQSKFVTLYRVACCALAQRDAEIHRLTGRSCLVMSSAVIALSQL